MDDLDVENTAGIDRRSALKRAAVAAGVVAWTTPAVVALTPKVAGAANGTTGCAAVLTVTTQSTGANCGCVPCATRTMQSECSLLLRWHIAVRVGVGTMDCGDSVRRGPGCGDHHVDQ